MNRRWQRIVSTTVAIVIATVSVFVCAPTVSASEGHCKPAQTMKAGCEHCPQNGVMDCCATSVPRPAVPQESQQQTTATAAASLSPVDGAVSLPPALAIHADALRGAPPHGYRSTALPILNSVFLI